MSSKDGQLAPSAQAIKEEAKQATKSSLESLRSLAAGGVGGVCAVVVGHPFDLVKVRLQTAEKGVYSGAIDVVRRTVAREGLARVCAGARANTKRQLLTTSTAGAICWCICAAGGRDAHV